MRQIGIAITDPQDWTAAALRNSAVKADCTPVLFRLHEVTTRLAENASIKAGKIDLTSLDAVIVRDMGGGGAEDMSYRFDVLCNLEDSGLPLVNPTRAIQAAANKHASSYQFNRMGIPTPDTLLCADPEEAFDAVCGWGMAVVKPIFGYKGMDIHRVSGDEASRALLNRILQQRGILYLQQFIPNPGRDIRAFVVDKKVIGAIYRMAPAGSWINNLSRGGSSAPCPVNHEINMLALSAADAVGAVYAGVDIIEGGQGLMVLEVNGTPSGRGIFDSCGVDVSHEIVQCVLDRI